MLNVVVGHSNEPDYLAATTGVIESFHDNLAGKLSQAFSSFINIS